MANEKFTRQQLEAMSPAQLQAIAQQRGVSAPKAGGGLDIFQGALRGGLQGFQGQPIEAPTTTGTDLETFATKERIKKLIGEEFKPTQAEERAEREIKDISAIRTRGAFKGIDIPTEATLPEAQEQVAAGLQEQVRIKRQQKIQDAVIKEQNKLSDVVGGIQIIEGDIESLLNKKEE